MAEKAKNKSIEKANEKIENLQKLLDEQIQKYQTKTSLIKHRDRFITTREKLESFISDQGADYDEFLEDSGKRVVFSDDNNYSSNDGISISNNLLVREFAQFLIEKINAKVAELEKEIIS